MIEERTNDDEVVERLVRLADRGPEIPMDGAERVKAAIRPVWQRGVRRRVVRKYAAWGGGVALAASIAVFVIMAQAPRDRLTPPQTVGTIEVVRGAIDIDPPAEHGALTVGSMLSTDGGSRAALRLRGGASLRLDVNSTLQVVSARVVVLRRGALYADCSGAERIEVRTDMGIARDIGTQFEVRRSGSSLIVRVREGAVDLITGRDETRVAHGTELTVAPGGVRRSQRIAAHTAEWGWIHSVTPQYAIEGRPVASFMTWVARETGMVVRYADRETEQLSQTTLLHGSLGELRPDEAPELILPSAGLEARRETDGTLTVRRAVNP